MLKDARLQMACDIPIQQLLKENTDSRVEIQKNLLSITGGKSRLVKEKDRSWSNRKKTQ